MPRSKAKDILSQLRSAERAQVLTELLRRHSNLHNEAEAIAKDLIDDVAVEAVVDEVASLVSSICQEELRGAAGRKYWGYVEPSEAAWELLEESLEDVQRDMVRRAEVGMLSAAEKVCLGIVFGLYSVRNTKNDGVLGWAPDFPGETAADAVSTFVECCPQKLRRAIGKRIISEVEKEAGSWVEMLQRVVDQAASAKRCRRK